MACRTHWFIHTERKRQKEKRRKRSYLEGAAIAVELTAHLSFGTVMLVTGQLRHKTNQSELSILESHT